MPARSCVARRYRVYAVGRRESKAHSPLPWRGRWLAWAAIAACRHLRAGEPMTDKSIAYMSALAR